MYVVYAQSFGGPRRPLGHFRAMKKAQQYAEEMNRVLPDDDLSIVEAPDGARKNFVDSPLTPDPGEVGDTIDTSIEVERMSTGGKK